MHTNYRFQTLESISTLQLKAIHASMQLLRQRIYISFKFSSIPSHLKNHQYFWIITILKTAATDFFQNNNLQAFRKEICAHVITSIVLSGITDSLGSNQVLHPASRKALYSLSCYHSIWTCVSSRILWWTKVTLKLDCAFCY